MTSTHDRDLRSQIPQVDRLLGEPSFSRLIALYGRDEVRVQMQCVLADLRREIAEKTFTSEDLEERLVRLSDEVAERLLSRLGSPLRRVLNATGVYLHTNLGRAPLSKEVALTLPSKLDAYCDLEMDLETGLRGDRNGRVDRLLRALTGAEASLAVNNNAAALVLTLSALAAGREVVVSRGELVEIGGSFRVPEILETAGARLVEVGTTNRTRIKDYERAIGDQTALLLKVYPSNYRIVGFSESVHPAALAALGRKREVPILVDEGSGLLRPHPAPQLRDHPSFQEMIGVGCDLVCGSGDKVLGSAQAGLLAGREDLVKACRRHPLYRALRPDRAALVTLEMTLRGILSGAPTPMDRLWPDASEHQDRLERAASPLGASIVNADAFIGGGSAPERPIPGRVLALEGRASLLAALRRGEPPVVGYIRDGKLLLDLRTIAPADDESLVEAVLRARDRISADDEGLHLDSEREDSGSEAERS